jgi:nucleoporin GLE1
VAYFYMLSQTAKYVIQQAGSQVEANPSAAFPIARIIMGVMLRGHAAFGTVLYARLVKKCPWVVPYWPVRNEVSL